MSIEIKIRKNEPIDRALRRMKKKLDRENIIKGTRANATTRSPARSAGARRRSWPSRRCFAAATTADAGSRSFAASRPGRPRFFCANRSASLIFGCCESRPRSFDQLVLASAQGRLPDAQGDGGPWIRARRAEPRHPDHAVPGILKAVEEGVVKVGSIHNFCPLPMGVSQAAPNFFQPSSPDSREREQWLRQTKRSIDFAAQVGASRLVCHLGSVRYFWLAPTATWRPTGRRIPTLSSRGDKAYRALSRGRC